MTIPVTTTFTIEGYRVTKYLGVVRGIVVRSPTIPQNILGGLKTIIGGTVGAYREMCEQTRQQAYEELVQHAQQMGANAVAASTSRIPCAIGWRSAFRFFRRRRATSKRPIPGAGCRHTRR